MKNRLKWTEDFSRELQSRFDHAEEKDQWPGGQDIRNYSVRVAKTKQKNEKENKKNLKIYGNYRTQWKETIYLNYENFRDYENFRIMRKHI